MNKINKFYYIINKNNKTIKKYNINSIWQNELNHYPLTAQNLFWAVKGYGKNY